MSATHPGRAGCVGRVDVAVLSFSDSFYTTRRLLEAGAALGARTRRIDPVRCTLHVGPGAPRLSDDGHEISIPDVVVPRQGSKRLAWGLALLEGLVRAGARTPLGPEAVRRAADKLVTQYALDEAGVPTLPTVAIRERAHIDHALAAVGGPPVVLKLRRGTQGRGVVAAPDEETARSALDALTALGQTVLLQPMVVMDEPRDLRVLVAGGRALAACWRHAPPGDFRSNFHNGGRTSPAEGEREAEALAARAAAALDLPICGVDLLWGPEGWVVIEVNGSPGLEGIEAATGRDLATPLMASAMSLPVD